MKNLRNYIKHYKWRRKYKKVTLAEDEWLKGRCLRCDAGNPRVQCSDHYCPCKHNQYLRLKKNSTLNKQ